MEIIIGLIIIIIICKILGVSNFVLILGGLGLIELIIIAMTLFFIYYTLHLFFTKKSEASFTKIDLPKKGKFKVAFYMIDGEEYPCIFPRESIIDSKVYKTDKKYKVRFSKSLKKVYDKWAVITCTVGLVFSIAAVIFTLGIIKQLGLML